MSFSQRLTSLRSQLSAAYSLILGRVFFLCVSDAWKVTRREWRLMRDNASHHLVLALAAAASVATEFVQAVKCVRDPTTTLLGQTTSQPNK